MSAAYASSLDISFDVRAGLVMRQMHHWAALVFLAALVAAPVPGVLHRRLPPAPGDQLGGRRDPASSCRSSTASSATPCSTTCCRARACGWATRSPCPSPCGGRGWPSCSSAASSRPPSSSPGSSSSTCCCCRPLIVGLLGAHLAILWRQKHTQFPGPGRTEDNIDGLAPVAVVRGQVGRPVLPRRRRAGRPRRAWPRSTRCGSTAPTTPAQASAATAGSQPDWYVGWLDGALRVMPGWEIRAFGHTIANPFFPGVLLPGLTFGAPLPVAVDRTAVHQGPSSPTTCSTAPGTPPCAPAIGAAAIAFYGILFIAGGNDVLASLFRIAPEIDHQPVPGRRIFVVPAGRVLRHPGLCRCLARDRRPPLRRTRSGSSLVRTPAGGYESRPPHRRSAPSGHAEPTATAATPPPHSR